MHNHWIILLIMAMGISITSTIGGKTARNDFPALFLWSMAGPIPGIVLLGDLSPAYNLIIIPILAAAIWRTVKVRRDRADNVAQ